MSQKYNKRKNSEDEAKPTKKHHLMCNVCGEEKHSASFRCRPTLYHATGSGMALRNTFRALQPAPQPAAQPAPKQAASEFTWTKPFSDTQDQLFSVTEMFREETYEGIDSGSDVVSFNVGENMEEFYSLVFDPSEIDKFVLEMYAESDKFEFKSVSQLVPAPQNNLMAYPGDDELDELIHGAVSFNVKPLQNIQAFADRLETL